MSAYDDPDPNKPYRELYRKGLHNQRARMARAMRALLSKRTDEVVRASLAPFVPDLRKQEQQINFVSVVTKAFEKISDDVEEQEKAKAAKYISQDDPTYTGQFNREVQPISFTAWMVLHADDNYRRVAFTTLKVPGGEEIEVSTIWHGIDMQQSPTGAPLIFESLVMGGKGDERIDRYTTLNEAQQGHSALLEWVRQMDGAS